MREFTLDANTSLCCCRRSGKKRIAELNIERSRARKRERGRGTEENSKRERYRNKVEKERERGKRGKLEKGKGVRKV